MLSKINKFLKNKKKNSKNQIKILSIFENLKINSNEISTNWNEFFINYSFELIKMKIFNQQKNKKIEKFLNLINVKYFKLKIKNFFKFFFFFKKG